jgi:hypothetical protein
MNRDIRHAQVGDDVIPSSQWTAKVVAVPETPDYSDTVTVQLGETSLLAQIPASMLKLRAAEGQRVNGEGQYQAVEAEMTRAIRRQLGHYYASAVAAVMPIVARELTARDFVIEHVRDRAHGEIQRLQADLAARDAVIEQIRALLDQRSEPYWTVVGILRVLSALPSTGETSNGQ